VSFTAVASVVSVLTVPLILGWSLETFMGGSQSVSLPASRIIGPVFVILAIPVGLGMTVRAFLPALATRVQKPLSVAATLIFVAIVAIAIVANWSMFSTHAVDLLPMLLAINLTMLALGFGLSRLAGVDARQSATVAIESSVQNGTLAIVIATSILKDGTMSVPGAIYGVMMYFTGIGFVWWMRKRMPPPTAEQQRADAAAMH
jgi:bile acid:Na+ symporter, BASS family